MLIVLCEVAVLYWQHVRLDERRRETSEGGVVTSVGRFLPFDTVARRHAQVLSLLVALDTSRSRGSRTRPGLRRRTDK